MPAAAEEQTEETPFKEPLRLPARSPGELLARIKDERGWTLIQMAEYANRSLPESSHLSPVTLHNWLNGRVPRKVDRLYDTLLAMDCKPEDIENALSGDLQEPAPDGAFVSQYTEAVLRSVDTLIMEMIRLGKSDTHRTPRARLQQAIMSILGFFVQWPFILNSMGSGWRMSSEASRDQLEQKISQCKELFANLLLDLLPGLVLKPEDQMEIFQVLVTMCDGTATQIHRSRDVNTHRALERQDLIPPRAQDDEDIERIVIERSIVFARWVETQAAVMGKQRSFLKRILGLQ